MHEVILLDRVSTILFLLTVYTGRLHFPKCYIIKLVAVTIPGQQNVEGSNVPYFFFFCPCP